MPLNHGNLWNHFEHVQGTDEAAAGKCKKYFKTLSIKNMLKHLKNVYL